MPLLRLAFIVLKTHRPHFNNIVEVGAASSAANCQSVTVLSAGSWKNLRGPNKFVAVSSPISTIRAQSKESHGTKRQK
jgi:hypothetical protein